MTKPDRPEWSQADHARIARQIMKRQAGLSIQIASVFLAMILGLPLLNKFAPTIAEYSVLGFPANWLFLGVLFYPVTVFLSVIFVKSSDKIEAECMRYFDADRSEAQR